MRRLRNRGLTGIHNLGGPSLLILLFIILWLLLPADLLGEDNWVEKGLALSRSGKYEEAVQAFTRAIEADPQHADAYNNRGAVWYYRGDYDRAIELKPVIV